MRLQGVAQHGRHCFADYAILPKAHVETDNYAVSTLWSESSGPTNNYNIFLSVQNSRMANRYSALSVNIHFRRIIPKVTLLRDPEMYFNTVVITHCLSRVRPTSCDALSHPKPSHLSPGRLTAQPKDSRGRGRRPPGQHESFLVACRCRYRTARSSNQYHEAAPEPLPWYALAWPRHGRLSPWSSALSLPSPDGMGEQSDDLLRPAVAGAGTVRSGAEVTAQMLAS